MKRDPIFPGALMAARPELADMDAFGAVLVAGAVSNA